MIKFDILHFYSSSNETPNLLGIEFKTNNETNNNEEDKNSKIAYIGESVLSISNSKKIKAKSKINKDSNFYMLTFMCSNVNEMYNKFKKLNIKVTRPKYSIRRNILLFPCRTKFKYMYVYPFKTSYFKFCFREINTSTDLINYQKSMIPNSAERDIMGIKEIFLNLNITDNDLETLSKIFDNSYIDGNEFSSEIYQNQTLTIKESKDESSTILFEVRGKAFKGKEFSLNNNVIKNNNENAKKEVTFIY